MRIQIAMRSAKFQIDKWEKTPRNPDLPSSPEGLHSSACMNPFPIRRDGTYWLFDAGGGEEGRRRICLATAPASDVGGWTRHGTEYERPELQPAWRTNL